MEIRMHGDGAVCILDIAGRMRLGEDGWALREALDARLAVGERMLVLNLAEVPSMDSGALTQLVSTCQRVRVLGGDVKLVLHGRSRLHLVFDVHENVDSAVEAYLGRPTILH